MTANDLSSGMVLGLILGLPLCVSVTMAARAFRKSSWNSPRKRRFHRVFGLMMAILGTPYTVLNAVDATNHESGTHWGIATVSIYLGYTVLLVPISLGLAYGLSFTAKKKDSDLAGKPSAEVTHL